METDDSLARLNGTDQGQGEDPNDLTPGLKKGMDGIANGNVDYRGDREDEKEEEEDDDDSPMPELIDACPDNPDANPNAPESKPANETVDKPADGDTDIEWMDVIGNGQLMKKILREGQGAATRPQRGERVTLRSTGVLEDGTEVDVHQEITFILGEGDVVSAWDLCLSLMDLGEISILKASPRFAYGDIGRSPDVPPNASITYELELLNVQPPQDPEDMNLTDLCAMGDKKRERGNELYLRKDYSGAINSYTMALKLLEKTKISSEETERDTVAALKVKCYNNLAAAQLKIEADEPALKSCNCALDIHPGNVKALFRKGKVLASLGEYEQAVKTLKNALAKEPSNKVIHQELSRLTSRESEGRQSERQLYQRMVGDMAGVTQVSPKKSMRKWLLLGMSLLAVLLAVAAAFYSQTSATES